VRNTFAHVTFSEALARVSQIQKKNWYGWFASTSAGDSHVQTLLQHTQKASFLETKFLLSVLIRSQRMTRGKMGRKQDHAGQAHNDEIRASIIREAISRAGLHSSGSKDVKNRDESQEQTHALKRRKVDKMVTGEGGKRSLAQVKREEMLRSSHIAVPTLGAATCFDEYKFHTCEAESDADRSASVPHRGESADITPYMYVGFPTPPSTGRCDLDHASQNGIVPATPQFPQAVNDASCRTIPQQTPVQPWPRVDVAPVAIQEEVNSIRTALALSRQREESSFQMLKAMRLHLHHAYRLIASQQRDHVGSGLEQNTFPDSPQSRFSSQHCHADAAHGVL
jgi:hypothetical protein